MTLCNLGVGATFGESILHDLPRDSTVVTKTTCELLRVEQQDFRLIWEVSSTVYTSDLRTFLDRTSLNLVPPSTILTRFELSIEEFGIFLCYGSLALKGVF